ncbi:hypothetical protein TNIN_312201 [Trichonephila inaurata madagascariensis]|uniref:Uncharacterized protein n=1 Tax=Trichonephila inaurata madagascariensis TaxID=2747483 RepID=A0A8X6IHZ9_9ARAC|nr:hypothetical protein TNIN_312201 [Trichonephila inaurata madagascariensis]
MSSYPTQSTRPLVAATDQRSASHPKCLKQHQQELSIHRGKSEPSVKVPIELDWSFVLFYNTEGIYSWIGLAPRPSGFGGWSDFKIRLEIESPTCYLTEATSRVVLAKRKVRGRLELMEGGFYCVPVTRLIIVRCKLDTTPTFPAL